MMLPQQIWESSAVQVNFSEDAISDLKKGKADAVLLGREPTADELKGLNELCDCLRCSVYHNGSKFLHGRTILGQWASDGKNQWPEESDDSRSDSNIQHSNRRCMAMER